MTALNKHLKKFSLEIDFAQKKKSCISVWLEGNPLRETRFSLLLCNKNVCLFVYEVITVTLVIVSFQKHYCCELLIEIIVTL